MRTSVSWLLPRNPDELRKKRRNSELWSELTWGQLGRSPDIGERVAERIAGLIMLDYVAWRLIAPGFVETDRLAHGGVALVVLYGTALGLRRLMPST